jgi:hypothetical protein
MKFITTEQLFEQFKNKDRLQLSDFVQWIEDEFEVNVFIEEPLDDANAKSLAEDPDVIRQIHKSREDRKAGRIFNQENGVEYLRGRIQEFESEQNL